MEIQFQQLTFTYPLADRPALENISFCVKQGEFVLLCGKSGCGKSTLLRQVKKELTPYGNQQGQVLYGSTPISELSPRKSACTFGFVMQNPDNQLVTEKVWQELAFGLENLGFSNSIIKRRVAEMASYFDISDIHRPVWQLSGGQKQLLNLASVMAMQPEVLLLDEPTSQLDPIAAREFLQTIYRINRELGTTVILCEHHLNEVFALADKVAVLEGGRLEVFGSPHEVANILCKRTPAHPMFWGMPTVTQIFQESEQLPLTLREGRQQLEHLLCNKPSLPPSVSPAAPQPKQAPIVELQQLWFSYEKSEHPVLKNLSLQIQQGEWLSILGSNGAGKSTALKAMCGQIRPQQGSVLVENQNIARSKKSFLGAGGLALVPQDPLALFTEITVEEELYEGISHLTLSMEEKLCRTQEMLQQMELLPLAKQNPYDLSGGEQQRLAIGKVLLGAPRVLLLDEPTKGLDPFFKRTLGQILKELQQKGLTICMVSHDVDFCAQYSDRCALFFDGEVVSQDCPAQFFAGNRFYTTTANQLLRHWQPNIVTVEEARQWISQYV